MSSFKMIKGTALALCLSVTFSAQAFDFGKAIESAVTLGKAATLSDSDVNAYFGQMSKKYDAENKVAPASNKYAKRLATITKGLKNYDGLSLNFKVYLSPEVNAFAMGDGTVRVYSGLMDLMTDDEVRSVIGHEIGHVKLGHSKKRMQTAMTTSALRNVASAAGGTVASLSDSQLGDLTENVVHAQFSQSNENDADSYGLKMLQATGKNPMASVTSLEKLSTLSDNDGGGLMATHPSSSSRAERMRQQIAKK